METPTSDFESFGTETPDDPLTPTTPFKPFQDIYKTRVVEAEKNGDKVMFTLLSTKVNEKDEHTVSRDFEDFEWLHHCLLGNSIDMAGIVIPALPSKPVTSVAETYEKSQKTHGRCSKSVIADHYQRQCIGLEKFLQHVLSHSILGSNTSLEAFLFNEDAPYKYGIKKGVLGKLTSAIDGARKSNHRDIDDHFQKEKDYAVKYANDVTNMHQSFSKVLLSEKKIASAYGHLATTLNMGGSHQLRYSCENQQANMLLVKFSNVIEDAQHCSIVDYTNDENTLDLHLEYSEKYAQALKEMFYRRMCLLITYEECNKALAKAKPNKQEAAEQAKVQAEKALECCSETARKEIVTFHQRRVFSFQEALCNYTEAKIKTARDTYALLMKSLVQFKRMEL